jgi:hypothetical protein
VNDDTRGYLDGNAAGDLRAIFAADITTASARCANCGATAAFAEVRLYVQAPGSVARCASCDHVLLRLVRSRDRVWLDARGLAYLAFETAEQT